MSSVILLYMRGDDQQTSGVFSYISAEQRVPQNHPLRPLRKMVDEVLVELSPRFTKMYAKRRPERSVGSLSLRMLLKELTHGARVGSNTPMARPIPRRRITILSAICAQTSRRTRGTGQALAINAARRPRGAACGAADSMPDVAIHNSGVLGSSGVETLKVRHQDPNEFRRSRCDHQEAPSRQRSAAIDRASRPQKYPGAST